MQIYKLWQDTKFRMINGPIIKDILKWFFSDTGASNNGAQVLNDIDVKTRIIIIMIEKWFFTWLSRFFPQT